jgi:hypothetical protein
VPPLREDGSRPDAASRDREAAIIVMWARATAAQLHEKLKRGLRAGIGD